MTSIGAWSFYQTAVSNVNLADSIIKINDGSFAYCKNLSEIKLPKNLVSLSSQVFQGTSLQSINIPASVNNVGSHTFAISSLQSITLSDNTLFDASAFWDRGAEYPHQLEIYCKGNFSKCQSNISNSFKKDIFAPAHTPEHPNIDTAYHTIHLNKRIYTVEEASRLSKPTGNTFKIRYK
ncbi:MAG: leucine-rich repeat domain-containing protein [Alphaproteobacteria bacterium]|nr:leucine-rich repeat domain-containing protein [Alphaproteobacteria bacterium]